MARWNVGVCITLAVLVPVNMAGVHHEPMDAFRAMGNFEAGVSIYTSTNDPAFKCLTATQTAFDLEARTTTYVWHFKGHDGAVKKNVTFYVREGRAPQEVTYFLDNDTTLIYTASCLYTDYSSLRCQQSSLLWA
ncbi:uncharacterized protein LOC119373447 isoform X2 [Rhipicephalus sanguineus]|uniref:uncharacterized protein LOC119373447 isoform X2 n=1 Tax=Rhipicephalus sanguineus TaxID=34632 RepID=UPI0020C20D86|nr:uncharacterized protein LOC119373447 isoform X2 [Rhipicephalus sanguineus]